MDNSEKKLHKTLELYRLNKIPFVKSKEELLSQGYSENEITTALYELDSKKSRVKTPEEQVIEDTFNKNPEVAEAIGTSIIKDLKDRENTERAANLAASQFAPGTGAQVSFYSKYSQISTGHLVLIIIAIFVYSGVCIILRLPPIYFDVIYWILSLMILASFVRFFIKLIFSRFKRN